MRRFGLEETSVQALFRRSKKDVPKASRQRNHWNAPVFDSVFEGLQFNLLGSFYSALVTLNTKVNTDRIQSFTNQNIKKHYREPNDDPKSTASL